MELSSQSAAAAPLKVQQGLRRQPLSCCATSQLGLLVRRSQMRGVRCSVVDEGGKAAHKNSLTKDGASASWLHPDSAADPFLGWTSDNSQPHHGTKAGWIKIGGALVLGIGLALGARVLYVRQAQTTAAPVVVTERTIASSEVSKPSEVQGDLQQNNVKTDTQDSEQDRQLQTHEISPNVKQEGATSERIPVSTSVDHMQEQSVAEGTEKTTVSASVDHMQQQSVAQATGRILVPASVDHMQEQYLAALQALKVIEAGVKPGDICTRREYARWLIAASARLSRSPAYKVFPAMYIENVSRPAYEDILPEDEDFPSIQGLAEAGMIYSRLVGDDTEEVDDANAIFLPDSPINRQDLVMWKKALERKPALLASDSSLPSEKALEELSGFIDIKNIHKDARPALLEDIRAGEQSIVALAFGYTRRFQPLKPVTKAQAAAALATGEAWELVSEELARLEAEAIAEAAVAAEFALERRAQQEVSAAYNELLQGEKEKQQEIASLVEKLQAELEQLKMEREEEKYGLLKDRAALDAERDSLVSMRREIEQETILVSSAKVEVSFQKEQVNKLHAEAEREKELTSKIRTELEVEKNALSSARGWAEEEARRALAHSKVLEQVRKRWEYQGIEVLVHEELQEANIPGPSWQYSEGFHSPSSPMGTLAVKSKNWAWIVKDAVLRCFHSLQLIYLFIKQQSIKLTENCGTLATKSKDLTGIVKDAVLRFFHSILLICQSIKQRSTKITENLVPALKDAIVRCSLVVRTRSKDMARELSETLMPAVRDSIVRFSHVILAKSKDFAWVVENAIIRFFHLIGSVYEAIMQRSTELANNLMPTVKDSINRFLHLVVAKSKDLARAVEDGLLRFSDFIWCFCQAITKRSSVLAEILVRVVKDVIARFLHFLLLVGQAIKQRATELAGEVGEKFHTAKAKCADSTENAIAGIKQVLPSSVTGMTANFKDGTLKAVAECRGSAERLVQKLKVS